MTDLAADVFYLHVATADTTTAPYVEVPVSTIAGYAGYGLIPIRGVFIDAKPQEEGDEIEYIDKEKRTSLYMRDVISVKLFPFSYTASAWDLSDWERIKPYLAKAKRYQFSWLELTILANKMSVSSPYHTAANAIPVQMGNPDVETTTDGYMNVTLNFVRKFIVPV